MKRNYEKFFTYPETAEFMVSLLSPFGNFSILEPSAGNGAIVKALRKRFESSCEIHAVELDNVWFDALDDMCEKVFIQDFLEFHTSFPYDACIANPPFGNSVDLQAHFDNICECVKEGGQIIMIVPQDFNPPVENRIYRLENWSKNSDGTTTPIKIISFTNPPIAHTEEPPSKIVFEAGKQYVLDKEFNNTSIVTLVSFGKIFGKVKSEESTWDTMLCRLSEIPQPLIMEGQEYDLKFCETCVQMTNHLKEVCQKCKSEGQGKEVTAMTVYEACYNPCIHESATCTLSIHLSKEGAEKAIEWHKKENDDKSSYEAYSVHETTILP